MFLGDIPNNAAGEIPLGVLRNLRRREFEMLHWGGVRLAVSRSE